MWEVEGYSERAESSLLASFNGVSVLTCDNLNLWCADHFVLLHLKRRVRDDERPYVVAKAVGVKVALRAPGCEPHGGEAAWGHTLSVVLVLTEFTIVSASDLSNWGTNVSASDRVRADRCATEPAAGPSSRVAV